MKGFHVEDASSLVGQDGLSEIGRFMQIFSSLQAVATGPARLDESPACKMAQNINGGLFDLSARFGSLNVNRLASMAAEKQIIHGKDDSSSKDGDGGCEAEAFAGGEEDHAAAAAMAAAAASGVDFDGLKKFASSNGERQMLPFGNSAEAERNLRGAGNDFLQASMACAASAEEKEWPWMWSDDFCMYEFKVRRCMRGRSHDWTECPFAHPGEKARRRDPRCYNYSGAPCPDFRKGACRKGESCELSHGVFECWLHPDRYRTQPCKDGKACKRRVCFFAHSPSQLRLLRLPDSPSPSPLPLPLPSPSQLRLLSPDLLTSNLQLPLSSRPPSAFPTDVESLFKRSPSLKSQASFVGSLDHSTVLAQEFEHHACRNLHQLHDFYIDDFSEPNGEQDRSHGYFSVADYSVYDSRKGHGYFNRAAPPLSSTFNRKAEASFRNHLPLPAMKASLDQLMSPTSILVGNHFFSPPPLSPPLSPAESPPASPDTAFSTWNCALSRKMASVASGHSLSYDAFSHNPAIGVDAMYASTPKYLPTSPSPLSAICDGDQMPDMDGLDALQNVIAVKDEMPIEPNPPAQTMADLISMLKDLRCAGTVDMKSRKRCPSLLQRIHSPKAGHGRNNHGVHAPSSCLMHDSGQGLGNLPTEEIDSLDLGWVNELVK